MNSAALVGVTETSGSHQTHATPKSCRRLFNVMSELNANTPRKRRGGGVSELSFEDVVMAES